MYCASDDPADIRLSAIMSKKGRGRNNALVRPWTKRLFALFSKSRMIAYYTLPISQYDWRKYGPPRELKRGELSLMCCSVEAVTQHPNTSEFPFRIFSPQGEMLIAATSISQRDEWIAAINELSVPSFSALEAKCVGSPPRPRQRSNSAPINFRRSHSAPEAYISSCSPESSNSGNTSFDSLGSSADFSSSLSSHSSLSSQSSSEHDTSPSVRDLMQCRSMDELITMKLENSPLRARAKSFTGICSQPRLTKKSFDLTEPRINEESDEEASLYISPTTSGSEGEQEAISIHTTNLCPDSATDEVMSPLFPNQPHVTRLTKHRHPRRTTPKVAATMPMEVESPFAKFTGSPPDQKSWEAIFQDQFNDDGI